VVTIITVPPTVVDVPVIPPPVVDVPVIPAPVPQVPVEIPVEPPVVTPTPTPVEPPAAPPPITIPSYWKTSLLESWGDLKVGGWVRHSMLQCGGRLADPNQMATGSFFPAGSRWALFGNAAGSLTAADGVLHVDSLQSMGGGFAMLSAQTFDHSKALSISTLVDLKEDRGSWLGITLIQDESDYRELSLRWDGGVLYADLYAPCFVQRLGALQAGPHRITLEYHPVNGWSYLVDGVLLLVEPLDHLGANLVGDPRAGIYIVNVEVEGAGLTSGLVRADLGPLSVSVGE
jgi:hypothetical protein